MSQVRSYHLVFIVLAFWLCLELADSPSATPASRRGVPPPPQSSVQKPPIFRADTTLVEVDAIVRQRDGTFAQDLTLQDFEVLEDGKAQNLEVLYLVVNSQPRAVPLAAGSPPLSGGAAILPPPAPRVFVLVFDSLHIRTARFLRAKAAAEDFLETEVQGGDLAGILSAGQLTNNRLTSQPDELQAAIRSLQPTADAESFHLELQEWPRMNELEAYRIEAGDRAVMDAVVALACVERPDSCGVDSQAAVMVSAKAGRIARQASVTASRTLDSLGALCQRLSILPGRKTVVLFSDGFIIDKDVAALGQVIGFAARAGVVMYALDTRGLDRGTASSDILNQAALTPPGLASGTAGIMNHLNVDAAQDAMNSLAVDTGGLTIRNENDFRKALRGFAQDGRAYYVLGYRPQSVGVAGQFRTIAVRVKRPGFTVRARKGYVVAPSGSAGPTAGADLTRPPRQAAAASNGRAPLRLTAESAASLLPAGVAPNYFLLLDQHQPEQWDEAARQVAQWADMDVRAAPEWFTKLQTLLRRTHERLRQEPAGEHSMEATRRDRLQEALGLTPEEVANADVSRLQIRALCLHTDIALKTVGNPSAYMGDSNVRAAEGIAAQLARTHAPLARAWYLAFGGFLTDKAPWGAGEILGRGLKALPGEAALWLAMGALDEAMAAPEVQRVFVREWERSVDTKRNDDRGAEGMRDEFLFLGKSTRTDVKNFVYEVKDRRFQLARAEKSFRRALELDSGLTEARLRLGRVIAEQGRPGDGVTALERVRSETRDPAMIYLASMFLGQIHHEAGRLAEARGCYEAALAALPASQSPRIALSLLADDAGDREGSLAALNAVALVSGAAAQPGDDVWWEYATGAGRQVAAELRFIREAAQGARTHTIQTR
jgi:VWFA-related protein